MVGQEANTTTTNRTVAEKQSRQINLHTQIQLTAQLQGALDTRYAKVGDHVILKTTEAVKQEGRVIIPKGAQLIGHVTSVQPQTQENSESHIGLLFDRIRTDATEIPINSTILSIAQPRDTQTKNATIDGDLAGQSAAGTRAGSVPRNSGGGLLGTGNTGAGVINGTTATVGSVAGITGNAVGSTVGATTNTTGDLNRALFGLQITQSSSASAPAGATLSLAGNNLRLESGTTFNLAVSGVATAGNP